MPTKPILDGREKKGRKWEKKKKRGEERGGGAKGRRTEGTQGCAVTLAKQSSWRTFCYQALRPVHKEMKLREVRSPIQGHTARGADLKSEHRFPDLKPTLSATGLPRMSPKSDISGTGKGVGPTSWV